MKPARKELLDLLQILFHGDVVAERLVAQLHDARPVVVFRGEILDLVDEPSQKDDDLVCQRELDCNKRAQGMMTHLSFLVLAAKL